MAAEPPFILNLAERLGLVDTKHPQAVVETMAVSMAELVRGLTSAGVFVSVTEAVEYDADLNLVTGCLYVDPGQWGYHTQQLVFFILKQGFVYFTDRNVYEYKLEI